MTKSIKKIKNGDKKRNICSMFNLLLQSSDFKTYCTQSRLDLSSKTMKAVANFVKTGDPSDTGRNPLITFPEYDKNDPKYLSIRELDLEDPENKTPDVSLNLDYLDAIDNFDAAMKVIKIRENECSLSKSEVTVKIDTVYPKVMKSKRVKSERVISKKVSSPCETSKFIETSLGQIEGCTTTTGNTLATGIQYGVISERFARSTKLENSTNSKAQEYAAACPSMGRVELFTEESELNCLTLNIASPENAENLPVMIYLSDDDEWTLENYDISGMSSLQNAVVITVDFRKSLLGFFAEETDGTNSGLFDIQLAISYVIENVASFGGKPDDLVLVGNGLGAEYAEVITRSGMFSEVNSQILLSPTPQIELNDLDYQKMFRDQVYSDLNENDICQNEIGKKCENISDLKKISVLSLTDPDIFGGNHHQLQFRPTSGFITDFRNSVRTFIGYTSNEGSYISPSTTFSETDSKEALKELTDWTVENMQTMNPSRIKFTSFTEYASQGKTLQERAQQSYYQNKAVQFYGDKNYVAPSIALANYTSEFSDTVLFHHDVACGEVQSTDFDSMDEYAPGAIQGQPARAIDRQFWGEYLLSNCDYPCYFGNHCATDKNIASVREIISDFVNFNNIQPKYVVNNEDPEAENTEIYIKTTEDPENAENVMINRAAYWPSRRPVSYWNRVIPALNILNTCFVQPAYDEGDDIYPEATVTNGNTYVGQKVVEFGREGLYTWYGIKYGEMTERFEKIGPVKTQTEKIRAKTQGKRCPQTSIGFQQGKSVEDCFTMDIFKSIPDDRVQHNSVLIYLCDGAKTQWQGGSSEKLANDYCGDSSKAWMGYLAEDTRGGTVVVKVNYRQGVLGFIDGRNLGLDDARKSFEFVRDNIQEFGGDSTKITIMGEGMGAAVAAAVATIYPHEVSGVVLQSGTAREKL